MEALALANQARREKARVKREIKSGQTRLSLLLAEPPCFLEGAEVLELVLAVPKLGRVKASKLLAGIPIPVTKTVGALTDRQRAALIGVLDGLAAR